MSNFVNKLFCEDCRVTMKNMICGNFKVDAIITSPPYNTVRDCLLMKKVENKNRYDIYEDFKYKKLNK